MNRTLRILLTIYDKEDLETITTREIAVPLNETDSGNKKKKAVKAQRTILTEHVRCAFAAFSCLVIAYPESTLSPVRCLQ